MNYIRLILISTSFILLGMVAEAQTGKLVIDASGFENSKGAAIVNLFREQDDIPRKPFIQMTGEITDGRVYDSFARRVKILKIATNSRINFWSRLSSGTPRHVGDNSCE